MSVVRQASDTEIDQWILGRLAGGPVASNRFLEDARQQGYGRSRVFRARARLLGKVQTRHTLGGKGGQWVWELKPQ